ncbi:DUF6498-containing protein [Halorubrum tebenquichense]|uniref:Uncharacterized protein n=1 Tax=Halorubrum tebenquichense DSM 14210 TaxID=1227485 RepID=M0E3X0_9EURY|nr:DUF6498-containing protein [Halorubrum tebenquichense]ELZ41642.1 hypothetical protein C472_00878 [Halorubrum tebenquichense DSM 14210]
MDQLLPPQLSVPDGQLLSVVVASTVPVAGLLVFGTSAAALVVFYWLELSVCMIWALVRGLFAGKLPSEETEREPFSSHHWTTFRYVLPSGFFEDDDEDSTSDSDNLRSWQTADEGSTSDGSSWRSWQIQIPKTNVGIYLGTIPGLVVVVFLFAVLWVGFGGVVAGPVVAAADMGDYATWPLTGAGIVFLSEGVKTGREYFYDGGYHEKSVWTAARGIFYKGFVLVGAGLLVFLLVYESIAGDGTSLESAASGPIIFTVIGLKFVIDLTGCYLDSLDQPLRDLL